MLFKTILIYCSGGPFVWQSEAQLCNTDRGYYEEYFCEIILNLDQWFRKNRKRCRLKIYLIYSSGGHFVLQSESSYH